jgi:hypothetical protein
VIWRESGYWEGAQFPPRDWQRKALAKVLDVGERDPSIIQAIMGAGKSHLIAEICATAVRNDPEVIVVSTSSRALVYDLTVAIGARIGIRHVGRFYTAAKQVLQPVIVTCTNSLAKLSRILKRIGRKVVLWVADEAHRTECDRVTACHEQLDPRVSIGFTATPYRSAKSQELSLWKRLVYSYGPSDALRDGVVVRWRIEPWVGDEVTLDEACADMIESSIGPGVVNASSIMDAENFRSYLEGRGISCLEVHSKLDFKEIRKRIALLEKGEIRCIVHVSMLQEGVNLPWLKWLCMRRAVKSRVRFAQEVGRVLRAHPSKSEAVIYDPHDLFGQMKISYDAVLQGGTVETMREVNSWSVARALVELGPKKLKSKNAEVVSFAGAYLRQLTSDLEAHGVLERKVSSKHWRGLLPTHKQVRFARSLMRQLGSNVDRVPSEHRTAMRHVCRVHAELNRGQLCELIEVLKFLKKTPEIPSFEATT